jgi:hypothetical protein
MPSTPSWLAALVEERLQRTESAIDPGSALDGLRTLRAACPADHPDRARWLSLLGNLLYSQYLRDGTMDDLDEAISASDWAVYATPDNNPDQLKYLSNLALMLSERFQRQGNQADADEAIGVARLAVAGTTIGDGRLGGRQLNLAMALWGRFERLGDQADLNTAINVAEDAVTSTPPGHRDRAETLGGLGLALYYRYRRTGSAADLNRAIENLREAADLPRADGISRARFLANVAYALRDRFKLTGDDADIDAAAEAAQAAVDLISPDAPYRGGMLIAVATIYFTKLEKTGEPADLETAITAGRLAAATLAEDQPQRGLVLSNLATMLRFRLMLTGAPADRREAFAVARTASGIETAPPSVRIHAARLAASLVPASQPAGAADLLELATRLLPRVAPRELGRGDQQHEVGRFSGLASQAAARVLADRAGAADQRAERALAILETGRAILLSQALDTRNDVTDLRARHPDLAARFTELRDLLDQPDADEPSVSPLGASPGSRAQERDRHRLTAEIETLIDRIRELDGFASFGLPPSVAELLAEARQGPVVTFNVSVQHSDALLLTANGITSLELPGLGPHVVQQRATDFQHALRVMADPDSRAPQLTEAQQTIAQILEWLWDNALGPVMDALGYHERPDGAGWPRVWWIPGGLLSLLPVHAAGHHADDLHDPRRRAVLDRVISSYTPTIRALRYARQHGRAAAEGSSLIVSMPVTPDLQGGELPYAEAEASEVRTLLPRPVMLTGADATLDNVLANLPGSAIAHFACHGASDPADPSQSRLLLNDHKRAPLTVARLASVNLEQAQLAYLSACRTAFADNIELIDETIHVATAFQMAGFPQVIGTGWEINDRLAPQVAATLYAALRPEPGMFETSQAATALHRAIQKARGRYPLHPYLWGAFLHAGA